MADSTAAIQVTGLTKKLGGRLVFRDVNLTVRVGEIVALTGSNGAGKTTLLRCMSSALRPTSGDVRWLSQPVAVTPAARALVGYSAHDTFLYPHLTVRENLLFAARMYRVGNPIEHVQEQLERAGLSRFSHQLAFRLSQGMRRRVSILRATVHAPPIVLLDEPFSGIDADGRRWLTDQLEALRRQNHALCFVSHDHEIVERLADRVLHMQSGRLSEIVVAGRSNREKAVVHNRAA